ncbi:hypothetical protein IAT38_006317 [Cryptococcus sp. DSM 104549]
MLLPHKVWDTIAEIIYRRGGYQDLKGPIRAGEKVRVHVYNTVVHRWEDVRAGLLNDPDVLKWDHKEGKLVCSDEDRTRILEDNPPLFRYFCTPDPLSGRYSLIDHFFIGSDYDPARFNDPEYWKYDPFGPPARINGLKLNIREQGAQDKDRQPTSIGSTSAIPTSVDPTSVGGVTSVGRHDGNRRKSLEPNALRNVDMNTRGTRSEARPSDPIRPLDTHAQAVSLITTAFNLSAEAQTHLLYVLDEIPAFGKTLAALPAGKLRERYLHGYLQHLPDISKPSTAALPAGEMREPIVRGLPQYDR